MSLTNSKNIILVLAIAIAVVAIVYLMASQNSFFPTALAPANNVSPAPTTAQLLEGKTLLSPEFPLKPGHELYMEYDARIVPQGKLFDWEASRRNLTQVKTADDLAKLIGQIDIEEQALAFVKFFTSSPTRHLLKPNPFSGIEPEDSFAQMPGSLKRLLTPATANKEGNEWIVERDLLLYPDGNQEARLVRSKETISSRTYTFTVQQVLLEGDQVNNLLPYYD